MAGPPLSQDLYCPSTSTITGPLVLQDFHYYSISVVAVSFYFYWFSYTCTVPSPPRSKILTRASLEVFQDLHCSSISTIPAATPLPQDLKCLRNSTVTGPQLMKHFNCHRTSTVAGPPNTQPLHCHKTSNLKELDCCSTSTVVEAPLLWHFPCPGTSIASTLCSEDLNC